MNNPDPMEATLTPEACAAICAHMNDDHGDALVAYARVYGGVSGVATARMIALDERSMVLDVESAGESVVTRIAFDHVLADSNDARDTLIAMARRAMTDA